MKIELICKYFIIEDKRIKRSREPFYSEIFQLLNEQKNKKLIKFIPKTGNIILNKYLHILQMVSIAFRGKKFFEDDLICFQNGGVVLKVWKNFDSLIKQDDINEEELSKLKANKEEFEFLKKFINIFKKFSIIKLIEMSHLDKSWIDQIEKRNKLYTGNKMDMLFYTEEYQYLWSIFKDKFK